MHIFKILLRKKIVLAVSCTALIVAIFGSIYLYHEIQIVTPAYKLSQPETGQRTKQNIPA